MLGLGLNTVLFVCTYDAGLSICPNSSSELKIIGEFLDTAVECFDPGELSSTPGADVVIFPIFGLYICLCDKKIVV